MISSEIIDKYAELRNQKSHVYSEQEIKAAMPVRREYFRFWNEQSLHLHRQGYKKATIEPLVKTCGTLRLDMTHI